EERAPRARLLPGGRPRGGDGVPRAAAAREHLERVVPARAGPRRRARGAAGGAVKPFVNEPALELRRAPVRESLVAALRELDARLPLRAGERENIVSTDPGHLDRVVAVAASGDVDGAVEAAWRGFPRWRDMDRGPVLLRAAEILRSRRL